MVTHITLTTHILTTRGHTLRTTRQPHALVPHPVLHFRQLLLQRVTTLLQLLHAVAGARRHFGDLANHLQAGGLSLRGEVLLWVGQEGGTEKERLHEGRIQWTANDAAPA